jgi:hypothetical protein
MQVEIFAERFVLGIETWAVSLLGLVGRYRAHCVAIRHGGFKVKEEKAHQDMYFMFSLIFI